MRTYGLAEISCCALLLSAPPVVQASLNEDDAQAIHSENWATEAPEKESGHLRVLQLNIWQEGTSVSGGYDMIVERIAELEPDIVTLSEVRNYHDQDFHERLKASLSDCGLVYHGEFVEGTDTGILSRYPVHSQWAVHVPQSNFSLARLTLPGGEDMLVASGHLDYHHYSVYMPRGYHPNNFRLVDESPQDGVPDVTTSVEAVMAESLASSREDAVEALFADLSERNLEALPLIIGGDFNAASGLDWTEATGDLWDHHGIVIDWPACAAVMAHGMEDSWRTRYPDPVTHPGHTWPSPAQGKETTSWTPLADERERIDFLFHRPGHFAVEAAYVVGPRANHVDREGGPVAVPDAQPHVLHGLPWMSDHQGVLIDYSLVP